MDNLTMDRVRLEVLDLLLSGHFNHSELSKMYGVGRTSIYRWYWRWKKTGTAQPMARSKKYSKRILTFKIPAMLLNDSKIIILKNDCTFEDLTWALQAKNHQN